LLRNWPERRINAIEMPREVVGSRVVVSPLANIYLSGAVETPSNPLNFTPPLDYLSGIINDPSAIIRNY
jgi:hypothetical protein